ncbi:SDR family oxidoreductase [Chloroflexi bacterium TSY]|nr:SDR family oxidoreductase [Chloroflexi bacterium TSY]
MQGQRILITAGAAGIGRTIAEGFLKRGAQVHICDIDEGALAECGAAFPEIGATIADVSSPAQVDKLFQEVKSNLGGLDILVNNAGISGPTAPVEEITPEEWDHTLAIDISGQFYCTRLAVPLLKAAGGGSIVNLSSAAGLFGFPNRTPYVAAKWAVVGFTKSLAMELGQDNIRVNAICPGIVEGPRIDRIIASKAKIENRTQDEVRESLTQQNSMRTTVTATDVANMVYFICSEAGSKISGQALSIDGHTETLRT